MTNRILQILDNVRYWDTCPDDYKKDIETFLETQNQALTVPNVTRISEQLLCCCDNPDGFKEIEEGKETCSQCGNPY